MTSIHQELKELMVWQLWAQKLDEDEKTYLDKLAMLTYQYKQLIKGRGFPVMRYDRTGNYTLEFTREINIDQVYDNAQKRTKRIILKGEMVEIPDWECPYCWQTPYSMRVIVPRDWNSLFLLEDSFFNTRYPQLPPKPVGVLTKCLCLDLRKRTIQDAMPRKNHASRKSGDAQDYHY